MKTKQWGRNVPFPPNHPTFRTSPRCGDSRSAPRCFRDRTGGTPVPLPTTTIGRAHDCWPGVETTWLRCCLLLSNGTERSSRRASNNKRVCASRHSSARCSPVKLIMYWSTSSKIVCRIYPWPSTEQITAGNAERVPQEYRIFIKRFADIQRDQPGRIGLYSTIEA